MTLTSRTRAQGASIVTTLPAEVVRRLGIPVGQELSGIEDGLGGFRVVPHTPELMEAMDRRLRYFSQLAMQVATGRAGDAVVAAYLRERMTPRP